MWTLADIREGLANRLAEAQTEITFWGTEERDFAINEAQRWVASITKGVPHTFEWLINVGDSSFFNIPDGYTVIGEASSSGSEEYSGQVPDGRALTYIPWNSLEQVWSGWRRFRGDPRWLTIEYSRNRLWLVPRPYDPLPNFPLRYLVSIAVLPADLEDESDVLFRPSADDESIGYMQKYQGVVLNYATGLALLKERIDGEAERYINLAVNELQVLGVLPANFPPIGVLPTTPPTQGGVEVDLSQAQAAQLPAVSAEMDRQ